MLLSSTAEYALRAVALLARRPAEAQTTARIAEVTRVPGDYLAKVMRALARAGLVRSRRGLGGGFLLSRDPAAMSLLEVIEAVEPLRRVERCPLGLAEHHDRLCPLHRRIDAATAEVQARFREARVAELAGSFARHGGGGREAGRRGARAGQRRRRA